MGFFEGLKRMVQGKPVFEVPQDVEKDKWEDEAPADLETRDNTPQGAPQAPVGPKVLPVVEIESCDSHMHGSNMEVYADIQNNFNETIELDKIRLLGTMTEIDNLLKPGEQRQHRVYSGPRPTNTSSNYAELTYKNPSGDYFTAVHYIEYKLESDKTYTIKNFKLQHPIRDV